jgi:outer membrane protein assembly factor BamD
MNLRSERFILYAAVMAVIITISLNACGPKHPVRLTCEEYYEIGMNELEKRNWMKAKTAFETITYSFPGCELVDDAQYMLGETYYRQDMYIEAQFEYRRLVEDFRLSDRMEDAQFKLALAAYKQSLPPALDQSGTEEAIFRFQQYLDDFPNGNFASEAREYMREARSKIAQKDFHTARFYKRLDYHEAALIYLDHIISEYPDTGEWVQRARFLKAEILLERDQQREALVLLRAINQDELKPRLREDVQRAINRIQPGE